jgi:NAD(P)-dependent dehydrogenase (short-subunit alcohol dehydrogenase family)
MNGQRDLEGLRALVTGATSGIGQAVAEELGREGANVIVHGRDATRGESVVSAITAKGGKAQFAAADLSDSAELDQLVATIGVVDILAFLASPKASYVTGALFAADGGRTAV